MDIVTVTYARELHAQAVQSRSINQFVTGEPCTHWVIVEDAERSLYGLEDWQAKLQPWYRHHKLEIIWRHPEFLRGYQMPENPWGNSQGWIRQQCLKFWIHSQVHSDRYLVLDSKNWFTRPTDPEKWPFLDGCGVIAEFKPNGSYDTDTFWQWGLHCSEWLGKPIPRTCWSPITPFILRTDIVAQICREVNINDIFRFPFPSEFILYAFYSDAGPYRMEPVHFTVWGPFWPMTEEKIRAIEADPEVVVFARHREHNVEETIKNIYEWQRRLGLVEDENDW